jgi:tellurite methyltransferase
MSEADREKWEQRYREGAYAERTWPSALLAQWIDRIPPGRALDVACGAGRNALFLAQRGFAVDAVDISREALERGHSSAQAQGLQVNWVAQDLDEGLALAGPYQLILVIRYVNLPLIEQLAGQLAPGGYLLCEQHLVSERPVIGPGNPAYRVGPGELARAATRLRVVHLEEAYVVEAAGETAALARLVAQAGEAACRSAENDPRRVRRRS